MELRPLGFGEIFDRAVTLYIRNFVPFAAIVMVLVVPLAFLRYFMDRGSSAQFEALIRILAHPGRPPTQPPPTIFSSPAATALLAVTAFLSYALGPFVMNAVAVGVARLYRDRPVEFRACYEVVFRRWPQIAGLIGIELLVLLGWYVATVLIALAVFLVVLSLETAVHGFVAVLGIIALLFVFVVMLPPLAPLVLALAFAMYSAVIEERGVIASLLLGFSRVFNRAEFWRALLFSIAVFAIILGASTIFGALALIAGVLHLPALEVVIEAVPQAVITPFAVVLLAVYYFDVRIRREAFDLEASLERLTGAQVA